MLCKLVVKTRLQTQATLPKHEQRYTGVVQCFRTIYNEEGMAPHSHQAVKRTNTKKDLFIIQYADRLHVQPTKVRLGLRAALHRV
jgi:hypothetical protein